MLRRFRPLLALLGALTIVVMLPAVAQASTDFYVSSSAISTDCTQTNPCTLEYALGHAVSGDTVHLPLSSTFQLTSADNVGAGVSLVGDPCQTDDCTDRPDLVVSNVSSLPTVSGAPDGSFTAIDGVSIDIETSASPLAALSGDVSFNADSITSDSASVVLGSTTGFHNVDDYGLDIENSLIVDSVPNSTVILETAGASDSGDVNLLGDTVIADGTSSNGLVLDAYGSGAPCTTSAADAFVENTIIESTQFDFSTAEANGSSCTPTVPVSLNVDRAIFSSSRTQFTADSVAYAPVPTVNDPGANALFTEQAGAYYNLAVDSPAIDAGSSDDISTDPTVLAGVGDVTQFPRVMGSAPDIGAYESFSVDFDAAPNVASSGTNVTVSVPATGVGDDPATISLIVQNSNGGYDNGPDQTLTMDGNEHTVMFSYDIGGYDTFTYALRASFNDRGVTRTVEGPSGSFTLAVPVPVQPAPSTISTPAASISPPRIVKGSNPLTYGCGLGTSIANLIGSLSITYTWTVETPAGAVVTTSARQSPGSLYTVDARYVGDDIFCSETVTASNGASATNSSAPVTIDLTSTAAPSAKPVVLAATLSNPLADLKLRTALKTGLDLRVGCRKLCNATVSLTVPAATAKKLGLLPAKSKSKKPVVVAKPRGKAIANGGTFAFMFTPAARKAFAQQKKVAVTETASLTYPGSVSKTVIRTVTLH